MPNGGVPIHMVIRPKAPSDYLVYCHGAQLQIQSTADGQGGEKQAAVLTLDADEAIVLERFLRYWLRDEGAWPPDGRGTTVRCVLDI